jgi:hypothetical protein
VFAAYTAIQFYAASTYGTTLAANSASAVYLCFTDSCLVAPAVTNKLGNRTAMSLGILGYATLVGACSLLYIVKGEAWSMAAVFGGCVLGCGATLLWTGQGRGLILSYAAVAENSWEWGRLRCGETGWSDQLGTRHGSVVVQRFLITHRP